MVRPVADEFPVSQEFGSDATQGVAANSDPNSGTAYLVYLYGNYQPFGHAGQDIACPIGTAVHGIADGTVIWADWGTNLPGDDSDAGYRQRWYMYKNFPGIVTLIQHDGWISMYGHLSSNDAAPVGTQVKGGDVIALSGNTKAPGVTLGAHLHVGALVDMSYSSGGGLIYGCADPRPYYNTGSIQVQGSITPTNSQEDFVAGKIDADQAESIVQSTVDRLAAIVFSKADGAWQNGLLSQVLTNQSNDLNKTDGGYIVSLLTALQPGEADAAKIADAVVAAVGPVVATQVVDALGKKLAA